MRPDRRAKGRRPQVNDYKAYSDKVFSEALFAAYFRLNDEVAKLHKECAALQAESEKYRQVFQGEAGWTLVEPNAYAALQSENERLRKAGDAMHLAHEANFNGYPYTQNQVEKAMKAWRAAKGVQP